MKKLLLPTLLTLALAAPAFAAKGDKAEKKAARQEKRSVLATYDKNGNGEIDGAERDEVRKAFDTDAELKKLDTNSDGKLDDAEINAIQAHHGKGGKGAGKPEGKKKKNK